MATAHTGASDGKISAFLHIDPDDIAKPARTNTIHIYFNDQDQRFTMEGCDCKIKINQGNEVIKNSPLETAGLKTGRTEVFLPQDNFSYKAVVSGTPKTAGFFQPFKLKFDIDVGNPPAQQQSAEDGPNLLVRLLPVVVVLGIMGFFAWHKHTKMME